MKQFWKIGNLVLLFMMAAAFSSYGQPYVKADHLSWSVIYDYKTMSPAVVYYTLQQSDFQGSIARKVKHFKMDYLLPPPHRRNSSFTFSGYQRGHLCPSGDRDSRLDWFKDTFFTSNIVPMTPELNAGAWRDIEIFCRGLAESGHILKIACGPVSLDSTRASNTCCSTLVPNSYWKLAVCVIHPEERFFWLVPNCHQRIYAADCRHDLKSLSTVMPSTIYEYIIVWLPR